MGGRSGGVFVVGERDGGSYTDEAISFMGNGLHIPHDDGGRSAAWVGGTGVSADGMGLPTGAEQLMEVDGVPRAVQCTGQVLPGVMIHLPISWWWILLVVAVLWLPAWLWVWEGIVWHARLKVLLSLPEDAHEDIEGDFRIRNVLRDTWRGGSLDLSRRGGPRLERSGGTGKRTPTGSSSQDTR